MPTAAYPELARESRDRYKRRLKRLRKLGFKDYRAYIQSAHWRLIRSQYLSSDRPQACICGETENLHLHHLTYARIGAESLDDLHPLCPMCHAAIHVLERRGQINLDLSGFVSQQRAEVYALQLAPLVERAKQEYGIKPPLWMRVQEIEKRATPQQLASLHKRVAALERATHEMK